jgi:hypothetical protein
MNILENEMKRMMVLAVIFLVAGCAYETPVQRFSESPSKFKKPPQLMSHNYPEKDVYRIFQQGATGFVPLASIREDLELQGEKFCERQGKGMVVLGANYSKPPYILGNFPRMELIFAAVDKPKPF